MWHGMEREFEIHNVGARFKNAMKAVQYVYKSSNTYCSIAKVDSSAVLLFQRGQ